MGEFLTFVRFNGDVFHQKVEGAPGTIVFSEDPEVVALQRVADYARVLFEHPESVRGWKSLGIALGELWKLTGGKFGLAYEAPSKKETADCVDPNVDHPKHYNSHPSGVEAIVICEHMSFNIGSAMKYLFRAGLKTEDPQEDLAKAIWYIQREQDRLKKEGP